MGENSNQLDVISHDLTCQPLGLEKEFCDIDTVQDYLLEDMVRCSLSNKPSEYQKIWSILSDKSELCCREHAHMHDLYPSTGIPL